MTDTPPKPKHRRWRWPVVVLVFITGTVLWLMSATARERRLKAEVGGTAKLECLRHPEKVTLQRLKKTREYTEDDTDVRAIYGHEGTKITVDGATGTKLGELLGATTSYEWPQPGFVDACIREYAVEAAFCRGSDELKVWLCFGCADAMFMSVDRRSRGRSFEPVEGTVLKLIVPSFPNDAALQEAAKNSQ